MVTNKSTQFCIIGGGVIGLSIARALTAAGVTQITVIEKEADVAYHASGRNSGVLHAGIYYEPDTLKAKLCLDGNRRWTAFCKEKNLPISTCGKIIVTKNEAELNTLDTLFDRATANGARVAKLLEKDVANKEPLAKTVKEALWSEGTSVIDPKQVMQALKEDLVEAGVDIRFNTRIIALDDHKVLTHRGQHLKFEFLINAAGAYAGRIANMMNLGTSYKFLPFKGAYKRLHPSIARKIHSNIYPVPDLRNPFLGVHVTKSVYDDVYLGPTAIPAFGPENYGLLSGLDAGSLAILFNDAIMLLKNKRFRHLAKTEPKLYLHRAFYEESATLIKGLKQEDILPSSKVGIRPQLVNWQTKELVMDFVIEQGRNSLHILNAISPAFTAAPAFADYINNTYLR